MNRQSLRPGAAARRLADDPGERQGRQGAVRSAGEAGSGRGSIGGQQGIGRGSAPDRGEVRRDEEHCGSLGQ